MISFLRYSNILSGSSTAVFLFISVDKVENMLFKTVTADGALARQPISMCVCIYIYIYEKAKENKSTFKHNEMSFSALKLHTAVTTRLEWHDLAGTGFCRLPLDHYEY